MNSYYCLKCKKKHYRGKIYKSHIEYRQKNKVKDKNPSNEILNVNIDAFRPIAKRQLHRLLKKMKFSNKHELYKNEIIKLIKTEKKRLK